MNLETFFEKFDLFGDAPDAVAKMRELVLQLAVRGKLVQQDPKEGDADTLLEAIASAHKKNGRYKTAERMEGIDLPEAEAWHDIPASWRWVRLGEIGDIVGGGTPRSENPEYFTDQGIPWLTPADLNGFREKIIFRGRRCITQLGLENSSAQLLPEGSVLFSSRAPIGYVAIAGTQMATNQGFKSCVPFIKETNEFLYYYLKSAAARIDREAPGTTFREVSGKIVSQIPVPLPPLAEQKRIVAKVDELMTLCDRLEAQQQERETRHAALARASLARFADAPTPANLNFIFYKSYDISPADLRKSILNLAAQGKLIPQDPNDEPAVQLLDRVSKFRERFSAGKRGQAAKRIREFDERKCGYDIPDNWAWCRLGDIVLDFRYGTSRKCDRISSGVPVLRIPNIQSGRIDSTDLKFTNMPSSEFDELRLKEGDLLLVRSNGSENLVGRSAVATSEDERFAYAGYLVRARIPKEEVFSAFVHIALSTPSVRDQIEGPIRTTSGVKNINTTELSNLVLPLPPLAEQRRIVAKVDELMALVDALETQLTTARTTAEKLMEAVVAELTV